MKELRIIILCLLLLQTVYNVNSIMTSCLDIQMPIGCSCIDSDGLPGTIRCSGLTSMPQFIATENKTMYELDLSNNFITTLSNNAFQGNIKFQRINLYKNKIVSIADDAFADLTGLVELKISGDNSLDVHRVINVTKYLFELQVLHLSHFHSPNNELTKQGLFSFTMLKELRLENLNLTHIGSEVLATKNLIKLFLVDNSFSSIPDAFRSHLNNLEHLVITGNQFDYVPPYLLSQNTKVKFLDLSHNKITTLEPDCFNGVSDVLETLILNNNPISQASSLDEIQRLRALVTLRLQQIGLSQIPASPAFMRNKLQLKYLYLNGNQLRTLDGNMFLTTGYLFEKLDFSNNQLDSLTNNFFNGMSSLTELSLEDQTTPGIFLLPSFAPLVSLQKLNLEKTKLNTTAVWNEIRHLRNLVSLNLDETGITYIEDFIFQNMASLEQLSLAVNNIQSLTQEHLVGLKNVLKYLYLGDNRITTLNECVFHNFSSGLTVSLINNPLRCDCKLVWLKRKVGDSSISLANGQEKCSSPPQNANNLFLNVPINNFVCDIHYDPPVCQDYYLSTTTNGPTLPPTTFDPVTSPPITVSFTVVLRTHKIISINFTASPIDQIKEFVIVHENYKTGETITRTIPNTQTTDTIYGLDAATNYEVCVRARQLNNHLKSECKSVMTRVDPLAASTTVTMIAAAQKDDTGIIIGSVIGGIILLILLTAILYLVVFKRCDSKALKSDPVTPVNRAELPRLGYDSKRFMKKKKTSNGNNNAAISDNAANENIQVSIISNGQNNQQPNLGRISAGSYQALDENAKIKPTSEYMNGNETRPLPTTPRKHHSYQNEAFQRSPTSDTEPHPYSEIHLV